METHETLAFVTLGIFGVLAVWRLLRENRMGAAERSVSLALALGGAGFLIAVSVYGGRLVFDHAAGIPTGVLQAEAEQRTAGHEHAPGQEHGGAPPPAATEDSAAGHVDPPGTPAHTHEKPKPAAPGGHTHEPGTPAHGH